MNWFKHIKLHLHIKRVLPLLLILTLLLPLSSCALFKSRGGEQESPPPESNSPMVSPVPPDAVPPDVQTPPVSEAPVETSPQPVGYAGPDVPLRDATGDEFFDDAAFMGNSLMDGFRMFSGMTTCDYYAATSMTVIGATSNQAITLDNGARGTMVEGLTQKPYGKIYILLGINEIGMNVDSFIESYGAMLDTIIAAQPDCDIYIMSLTPVSAAKNASGDSFNMTRITQYNEALYKLAEEKECYYLDLVAALADSTGYLPSTETTDGVHFSAKVYTQWADYIRTHYI